LSKGAAAGIIIALLGGALLGYFVIPYFFSIQAATPSSGIIKTYMTYDQVVYINNAGGVVADELVVSFRAEQQVKAYCDFRCIICLTGDAESTNPEEVYVSFVIDGIIKSDPKAFVYCEDSLILNGDYLCLSIALQGNFTLSSGIHNITVVLDPYISTAHYGQYLTLFVMILKP
jgi:hypothetical protein